MNTKYALMDAEKANYPITMMAKLLRVARQGYYQWRNKRPDRESGHRQSLYQAICRLWNNSDKRHGVRRIHADLVKEGIRASLWCVRKIMRTYQMAGIQPKTTKRTTIADPDAHVRPDLVRRRFMPAVARTVLVGDITYLRTGQGWLYLATVIDLTTRMVVGWAMADHMRACLAVDALKMAHQGGFVVR